MITRRSREHPGEVLLYDFLGPRQITPATAARAIGVSTRRMNDVVSGKRPVNAELSVRLGRYFGISERFWIHLQDNYEMTMGSR